MSACSGNDKNGENITIAKLLGKFSKPQYMVSKLSLKFLMNLGTNELFYYSALTSILENLGTTGEHSRNSEFNYYNTVNIPQKMSSVAARGEPSLMCTEVR